MAGILQLRKVLTSVTACVGHCSHPLLAVRPENYTRLRHFRTGFRNNLTSCIKPTQLNISRGMAGHSKWQNIRHTKAAKDLQKARICERMSRNIRVAVAKAGTNDPKLSSIVANAVDEAKDNNVPGETIQRALKAGGPKDNLQQIYYEIFGPGSFNIIVETMTDNGNRTRGALKKALKAYPVSLVQGTKMPKFDRKGVFLAYKENGATPSADSAMEDAIELNVEEVNEIVIDEENEKQLQFVCDMNDFGAVRNGLKEKGYILKEAGLEYVANTRVKLSPEDEKTFLEVCQTIENAPDVEKIYENTE